MDLDELLARPGLAAATRLCILVAVDTWRGDWAALRRTVSTAAARAYARQDLEETLLQTVLFCGFPRAITAFGVFDATWPSPAPPHGGALPRDEQAAAGEALFRRIYGANDAAVRAMLRGHHQELHDFVLHEAYGRILTRPHLSARERELVAVAVLAAQDQPRQFVGHARGARHCGATDEELHEALVTTFHDGPDRDERVGTWWQRARGGDGSGSASGSSPTERRERS